MKIDDPKTVQMITLTQIGTTPTDEYRLLKLLKQADTSFQPPISTHTIIENYCKKLIVNAVNVLASDHQKDIGFISFYANDRNSKAAFITAIAVDADYRGCGYGAMLLNSAILISRTMMMDSISLEVNETNESAIALYRRRGFAIASRSKSSPTFLYMSRLLNE